MLTELTTAYERGQLVAALEAFAALAEATERLLPDTIDRIALIDGLTALHRPVYADEMDS